MSITTQNDIAGLRLPINTVVDNKKLYGSFVLSYILSFAFITFELFYSSYFSSHLLSIYLYISLCAVLCMAMGCVSNEKTRVIVLCFVIAICGLGYMIYNVMHSIWDIMRLVLVLIIYFGIGWYPAYRWINSKYGLAIRILSAIAVGNIVF